jgi:tellurite resistance protein TerC
MDLFLAVFLGKPAWMWIAFTAIVLAILAFDLGVKHRNSREISVRESLAMSAIYVLIGLGFGAFVWQQFGADQASQYLTAFTVEKVLAIDNVFVIAMVFSYFGIPRAYQHRVLFWGITGVIVLRAIMIAAGAAIIAEASWVLYLFGALLIVTGIKMIYSINAVYDVGANPMLKWVQRRFNVTDGLRGESFFVREADGKGKLTWFMTPLFLALLTIEFADVIFAIDSVPAIFAISTDPFIVFTSNIFAILGLRALYFALAAMVQRFHYLKFALAGVLIFIGSKIFVADLLGVNKIPPALSLGVTFALLGAGIVYSLWKTRPQETQAG